MERPYHNKQNEYLENVNNEAEMSAQIALSKAVAYIKAKGENILPTSFDCSWSHCRNANQASGELIFQGNLEGKEKITFCYLIRIINLNIK